MHNRRTIRMLLLVITFVTGCTPYGVLQETPFEEKSKTPTQLSFWPVQFAVYFPSGIQTDPVAKDIEAKLGIQVHMESQPTQEKFDALLASGDLPDVIVTNKANILKLIRMDALQPMDEFLDRYGEDIKFNVPKALDYSRRYVSDETGQLYAIPNGVQEDNELYVVNPYLLNIGPFLRWDYYKQLGTPVLRNTDDYIQVVANMIKKNPVNENGQRYVGFSPWFESPIETATLFMSWMEGKETFGAMSSVELDPATQQVRPMFTNVDSVLWKGVNFWFKVKQAGLMDPESFTQTYATALQKSSMNRVLASVYKWSYGTTNAYLAKQGYEDRGYTAMVPIPMEGAKNHFSMPLPIGDSDRLFAITRNCKQPEMALAFINYFYSIEGAMTIYNGIEGVDWVMKDGKAVYTDKYTQQIAEVDATIKYGYQKYYNDAGLGPYYLNPRTNQPLYLAVSVEEQRKNLTTMDQSMVEHYKVDVPLQIVPNSGTPPAHYASLLKSFVDHDPPPEIRAKVNLIQAFMEKAIIELILSSNEEEFMLLRQTVIDEVSALGYFDVYEYYYQQFLLSQEKAKPYMQ